MGLRNLTMRDLERQKGVSYRVVRSYLSGEVRMPAVAIADIADWLGVSPEFILTGQASLFDRKVLARCLADVERTKKTMEKAAGKEVPLENLAGIFESFYQNLYTASRVTGTDTPEAFRPGPLAWNTTQVEEVENAHQTEPSDADFPTRR